MTQSYDAERPSADSGKTLDAVNEDDNKGVVEDLLVHAPG
jgi:hypothetical protein